ncbi:sigma 54-interacting transcriptional regulator [Polyangium jinanense]|uniref:Sigma 54-interacting transcriptional regulator n=1 Tax=Polyangium jinanense TaxID=2829994 RepID=A0A9X3WZC1_9BACT|nr:sigma 54-interacting transcriptional regulator [Polyangium jinanense]MDC3955068.1 sigma 54-interacting transcriptional regulator [Polyangium jinanense]MDC3981162.1 sigma 54-interacting transcriptional regulator [Polyangium jinanense]
MQLPPRYEPIAPLGKGGGGEVWSAKDRITGVTVAVKVLAEGANEAEMLALVREAVALSGLEGLGVPRILGFGRLPNSRRAYLVRELVVGKSLAARFAEPDEPLEILDAIAQAADQLTRLHRALLLHGDLKPANIIVGPDGKATLVDLGLAANFREGGELPSGMTPRYAAPELLSGAPLGVRVEIYALGVTLREALVAVGPALDPAVVSALEDVERRATAADPTSRFPSADELASAIRRAASLPMPESFASRDALVWPIVGLDEHAAALDAQIEALRSGGGIVVTGLPGAGKSTLLRRVAWWLGVKGRGVAWVEAAVAPDPGHAMDLELVGAGEPQGAIVLVDDADRLAKSDLTRLASLREAGARVVVTFDPERLPNLPGPTLELFAVPPLDESRARDLVRSAIPSLGDVVADHVARRAGHLPGKIRAIVEAIARAPVASPADVDRLLAEEDERGTDRERAMKLLDRGHVDEAAEVLARLEDDPSPAVAIARARLFTSRGDAMRAIAELERVHDEALAADAEIAASYCLHASRALLRAGDYAGAETQAGAASERTGLSAAADDAAPLPRAEGRRALAMLAIAADALAVSGLAQSFSARHEDAKRTLARAVRLARAVGEPRILSVALGSLAFALQRDDQLDPAKAAYEEALTAAEQAGDAGSVATTRLNLAGIAKGQGDLAAALMHLEAAVDMGHRSGRVPTLRQALLNLANLELYLGRLARARVSIDQLALQRSELGLSQRAQLLSLEAEHAARSGDPAAAERLCRACAESWESLGRGVDAAEARLERVLIAPVTPSDDVHDLEAEIERASAALGGGSAHRPLLSLARGRVATLRGDERQAAAHCEEALEAARASGQKDFIARALEARAALHEDGGKPMLARRDREAALAVLEEIASVLPRDLREVFWDDPRRRALRALCMPSVHTPQQATTAASPNASPSSTLAAIRKAPTEERLARILEINRAIAGEVDLARLLEKVTDHAIALLGAERGFVILKSTQPRDEADPSAPLPFALSVHAFRGREGDDAHARFSQSIAERVVHVGEPIVTVSAREDDRMAGYVSVHQLMLQSIACVPIRARGGEVIGALYLETRLRPAMGFTDELPTLVALADQVAITIETARLVGENARRARELEKKSEELERANRDLEAARAELEELLGLRTEELKATKRDLRSARAVIKGHFGYEGLVGRSEAMRRVYALIDRVKDTDIPVLVIGESGTGKEVVARAIHNAGPRAKKPFVGINVGAIPEHLLESELFGHMRGAFTGADRDRRGLFREAEGGTILLDEIGEMPPKMQAGLLRVLQEKVVRPVGGAREEPVNTRVVAATHRDLVAMTAAGTFREDLLYRLHVVEVRVPPLRERIEDIPILIDHFLGIFAARYGRERRSVSRAALRRLMGHSWPGNVRQLENVLLNAWVLSDQAELEPEDFELPEARLAPRPPPPPESLREGPRSVSPEPSRKLSSLEAHKADERERILSALQASNWNRVKAARLVGLPRRTFYRRLKEYGIQ